MRALALAAIASLAFASNGAAAAAAEECFDKGALSYVDCAPSFAWTGFYIGGHGGYGETDDEDPEGTFNSVIFDGLQAEGGVAGAQAGFQQQFSSNVVVGVEVDFSAADVDDAIANPVASEEVSTELNWLASARLRLGLPIDRFLPFVTGGVAVVDYEAAARDLGGAVSVEETVFGAVVGAGLDVALDENWALGVEGLYYFFDETADLSAAGVPGDQVSFGDASVLRGRLSYRF